MNFASHVLQPLGKSVFNCTTQLGQRSPAGLAQSLASSTSKYSLHQRRALSTESVQYKSCRSFSLMARLEQVDRLDPHAYTTGRWLRRDKLELDARYINFDFDSLCQQIIRLCPGASSIVSYDKKEGGFNRVFLFVLDNGKRLVAKLPFSVAGPPRLPINSEAATIKYLQSKTSIPIPNILEWNNDPLNPVGSEYIITEHVGGVQLHQRWPHMSGEERVKFVDSFCRVVKEMIEIELPAYGSLYIQSDLTNNARFIPFNDKFYIGPHCGSMFWDCNVGEPRYYHSSLPNQGPWSNFTAYCDALIDAGISRIPPTDADVENLPRYHGFVSAHLELLEHARSVIKQMAKDERIQKAAQPVLLHPDLNKRNNFVAEDDPTCITGIIDWQSVSIEPAFWHTDKTPDFAQECKGGSEISNEACSKALEVCIQYYLPRLAVPRLMDEAFFRPFRYCHRTWKDGAVALRHELVETARCWDKLQLKGSCPFKLPSRGKLSRQQKDYRLFEAAQTLRRDLSNLIDVATDGWVPSNELQMAKDAQHEMYEGMLEAVLTNQNPEPDEPVRTEADLREIWPFDL